MPIAVMCPKCGEQGRVPDGYRESVTCRGCRTRFRVEGPGTPEPPAPVDPIDPGVKPAPADPPGKPRRPHQVNLNVVAASASAVVLITAAGLLVAFAWPSGEDDPLAGIAATTRISDDEGDRMIDRALDRWTDAVKQFSVDQSDKSDAFQARRRAEFGAVIDRVSAPHRALLDEAARYFPDKPREIYLDVMSTRRMLRANGVKADTSEILRGAIYLRKNSRHPGPNTQKIRAFDFQYQDWRERGGLSHDEAIQKMFELEKF